MNNQSGLTSDLYGNIFRMREFLIKDLLLKNNIQHIKQRTVNAKTSLLKPPNIYSIKKPSSPKPFSKSPIKTFIPVFNMQRTSPIKTSPPDIKKTNYKNISVSRFNYQHKVKSIESEKLYQTHKSHVNQFLQFKRRDSFNKSMYIEKENEKFGKKLIRVNSPLSKNRLDESYSKLKEYGNIAKKIKPDKELNIRKINHVKSHLPPLLIRGSSNKKFNLFFKN